MAIKMRNNKDLNSVCCECGDRRKDVLDMFDLCVGGNIITVCDVCNEKILVKTLRAECAKNERVKMPSDLAIMRRRASQKNDYKARWQLSQEEKKAKGES